MPTFTGTRVSASAQTLTTSLSLADIRDLLNAQVPILLRHLGGWRALDDTNSNLGTRNGTPPQNGPQIWPAAGDFPERLAARYYYWAYKPLEGQPADYADNWELEAVDVLVSAHGTQSYLVLWSTQDEDLIKPSTGDTAKSFLRAIQTQDGQASLQDSSALHMGQSDIYLWLAQQSETAAVLGANVVIKAVSGVDAEEDARLFRTATLRGEVDMQRIAFLSALAEQSTMGPAIITLSEPDADGKFERVIARVWIDGRFTLLMTKALFRNIVHREEERLEAAQRFAYRYIPLIIRSFTADANWRAKGRDWLILEKSLELSNHYRAKAEGHARWAEFSREHPTITST